LSARLRLSALSGGRLFYERSWRTGRTNGEILLAEDVPTIALLEMLLDAIGASALIDCTRRHGFVERRHYLIPQSIDLGRTHVAVGIVSPNGGGSNSKEKHADGEYTESH
jgi:hypothetical protein